MLEGAMVAAGPAQPGWSIECPIKEGETAPTKIGAASLWRSLSRRASGGVIPLAGTMQVMGVQLQAQMEQVHNHGGTGRLPSSKKGRRNNPEPEREDDFEGHELLEHDCVCVSRCAGRLFVLAAPAFTMQGRCRRLH
jgi:hypothetical protein